MPIDGRQFRDLGASCIAVRLRRCSKQARHFDTLGGDVVFFDMTSATEDDAIDGPKVDRDGNVYVSGPGGSPRSRACIA